MDGEDLLLLAAGGLLVYWFMGPRARFSRMTAGATMNLAPSMGSGAPQGSGLRPIGEPKGSEPYQAIGVYDPLTGSNFPSLQDNSTAGRIVTGTPVH